MLNLTLTRKPAESAKLSVFFAYSLCPFKIKCYLCKCILANTPVPLQCKKDYFSNGSTDLKFIPYYDNSGYTKYNNTDKITQLQPVDDAATLNWGKACRIPTNNEFNDLITKTTYTWSSSGAKFTGKGAYSTKSITLTPHVFLISGYLFTAFILLLEG